MKRALAAAVVSLAVVAVVATTVPWKAIAAPGDPPGLNVQQPQPFKKILVYDQIAGTFPSYTVPAGQRITIRQLNIGVMVQPSKIPVASVLVRPPLLGATYQQAPIMAKTSNFQDEQDRWAANDSSFVILEAGEILEWYIADADGEFYALSPLNAFISLSGEVVSLGP